MSAGNGEAVPANSVPGKIVRLVRQGWRVLDVGCGAGRLAALMTSVGATVTGLEREPRAAALARNLCARVFEADLEQEIPLDRNERFDAIVCADVLEHMVRPDRVLARLTQHLGDRGVVIVSLPNVAHYTVRIGLLRGRFDYEPSGILDRTHLRFFTRTGALQLLAHAGLTTTSVDAVYAVPAGRLARLWPRMPDVLGRLAPEVFAAQWVLLGARQTTLPLP